MALNWLHPANRVLVSGITGSGKTWFVTRYIQNAMARNKHTRCIIFDWQEGEISHRLGLQAHGSFQEFTKTYWDGSGRILGYDALYQDFADEVQALDAFCEWTLVANDDLDHSILLVIDEMGQLFNHGKLPYFLKRCLVAGRRKQIDMVIVGHQVNELHFSMRNHVTQLVIFQQGEELAVNALHKLNFKAPEADFSTLKVGEYWLLDKSGRCEHSRLT